MQEVALSHILELWPNCRHKPPMTSFLDHHPDRIRRSILCLPASNPRAIAKIASLDADAYILDLEDSVAEDRKAEARDNIRAFFRDRPAGDREIIIRVNDRATAHFEDDMRLVLDCAPDAVLLPKVETDDDIRETALFLSEEDAPDTLRIWAMMETPLSILNAGSIAESGRTAGGRLDCLVVGLNDLRKATGVAPDPARTFLVPWLMQVVLAARAFGLMAIDSVSNDFRDLGPYVRECDQGRAMGFDGKMLIHPDQIAGANAAFRPAAAEIAEAEAIIAAFADPAAAHLSAINLNGRMVERLHLDQADRLIRKNATIQARTSTP